MDVAALGRERSLARWASRLFVGVLAIVAGGCEGEPRILVDVVFRELSLEVEESIAALDVALVEARTPEGSEQGCAELSEPFAEGRAVLYRETFELEREDGEHRASVAGPLLDPVDGPLLGLARAFDGSCDLVAEGCTESDADEETARLVVVRLLEPASSSPCLGACEEGVCDR